MADTLTDTVVRYFKKGISSVARDAVTALLRWVDERMLGNRIVALSATASITMALHDGKTVLLTGTGAQTYTLPAPTGSGFKVKFIVGAVNTSSYIFKAAAGTQLFKGTILGQSSTDSATDAARTWVAGSTSDTLTLNGTTTGGAAIGDYVEFEDISATHWQVNGVVSQSGVEASPFSDTVT